MLIESPWRREENLMRNDADATVSHGLSRRGWNKQHLFDIAATSIEAEVKSHTNKVLLKPDMTFEDLFEVFINK